MTMRTSSPTVSQAMTRDVIAIGPDATLSEAMTQLADSHVSGLAVLDGHKRLVGVISTTDILTAEAEAGDESERVRALATTMVRDVMTPRPLTVAPETALREAALQMDYADVHRLFVEADGVIVGVLSRSDINRMFAAGAGA
jgi:CBS domain-containing membrane protein